MWHKKMNLCPECLCTRFEIDEIHDEIICSHCGLVVQSPPSADYSTPGTIRLNKKTYQYLVFYWYIVYQSFYINHPKEKNLLKSLISSI